MEGLMKVVDGDLWVWLVDVDGKWMAGRIGLMSSVV